MLNQLDQEAIEALGRSIAEILIRFFSSKRAHDRPRSFTIQPDRGIGLIHEPSAVATDLEWQPVRPGRADREQGQRQS